MSDIFDTYRPEGFSTVNAYMFVEDPERMITFLEKAFQAKEKNRTINPHNGDIANVILLIGESCIMLSQARGNFLGMRSANYLYVNDVDTVYATALAEGAKSVFEPANMDYGDRQGGIEDPAGNYWWISTRFKEEDYGA